jgi:hypothetical protein
MIINQLRTYFTARTTSELYVDGVKLIGSCLEDIGRPQGVKIQDETCIPEGVYGVKITLSSRFKKPLILLYNQPVDLSVVDGTAKWTGIRVHSGSTVEHTAGCVLFKGYEALQEMIQAEIDAGQPVYWIIGRA